MLTPLIAVASFHALVTLLHVFVPAISFDGYACDSRGAPLKYRLNGAPLLLLTIAAFFLSPATLQSYGARNWWACVAASNSLGLFCSVLLMRLTPEPAFRCLTTDQKDLRERAAKGEKVSLPPAPDRNLAQHYFFGLAFNPRLFGVDLKMLLYALGACALAWNTLSAMSLQASPWPRALLVYAALLFWFLLEYMCLECVHLYTYDLFCEKLGFKLCWGCLLFYPFFYCIGVWPLVLPEAASNDISRFTAMLITILFFCGWGLTRGANLQKYLYKRGLEHPLPIISKFLASGNHTIPNTRLLCTGFWGLARHINYCGEIVQAVALALPGTLVATTGYYTLLPWLYPLYYIALFIPRQIDDDLQIATKYGEAALKEYQRRVPWRIVPGVW